MALPAPNDAEKERTRGTLYALVAYGSWGVVPLFWKLLDRMGAAEILAYRVACSVVFVLAVLAATKRLEAVRAVFRDRSTLRLLIASSLLIALNWGVFIWAVTTGHLVDASLGYFVNPLVSVVLGVVLLRERLRRLQWIAVALGGVGLALMFLSRASGLVVPLTLALTFATYGYLRKMAPVESMIGLFVETLVCAPLAIGYLIVVEASGEGILARGELTLLPLALLAGPVTAVPLAAFAAAARRMPLSTLGFFQYIAPSLQFLTAVVLFGEKVEPGRFAAFAIIWAALAAITLDAWRVRPAKLRRS